jgi:hypothetical protein
LHGSGERAEQGSRRRSRSQAQKRRRRGCPSRLAGCGKRAPESQDLARDAGDGWDLRSCGAVCENR